MSSGLPTRTKEPSPERLNFYKSIGAIRLKDVDKNGHPVKTVENAQQPKEITSFNTLPEEEKERIREEREKFYKSIGAVRINPINTQIEKLPDLSEKPLKEIPEYSWADRAMQVGRGVGNTYAGITDLFNEYISSNLAKLGSSGLSAIGLEKASQWLKELEQDYRNPTLTEKNRAYWNEKAGKDLAPKDFKGRFLETGGEFLAPLGFGIGGAKAAYEGAKAAGGGLKGVKEASKIAAEKAGVYTAEAAGGSALMNLEKDNGFFAPDTLAGYLSNLGAAASGSAFGRKLFYGGKKKLHNKMGWEYVNTPEQQAAIDKAARIEAGQSTFEDLPFYKKAAVKWMSKGEKTPELIETLETAKEYGIPLQFNIESGTGNGLDFIANNLFRSAFTNSKWHKSLKKTNEEVSKHVKEIGEAPSYFGNTQLLKMSRSELNPYAADFLRETKEKVKNQSSKYFDMAEKAADPEELLNVDAFYNVGKDYLKKMPAAPTREEAAIAKDILKVFKEWGIGNKADTEELFTGMAKLENGSVFELPPHLQEKIKQMLREEPKNFKAKAGEIRKQEISFNRRYDPTEQGLSKFYGTLAYTLKDSLETTTNPLAKKLLQKAKKYYKEEVKQKIESDIANKLLNGQTPREAMYYMNTVQGKNALFKVLGDTTKANEIKQSLVQTKLDEILSPIFQADGQINYNKFIGLFNKKGEQNEVLINLMGKANHNKAQKLVGIVTELQTRGKALGTNYSGTAITSSDISSTKDILGIFFRGIGEIAAVGAPVYTQTKSGTATIASAATIPAITWGLSKIFTDEVMLNAAYNYAKALSKGNEKGVEKGFKSFVKAIHRNVGKFVDKLQKEHVSKKAIINKHSEDLIDKRERKRNDLPHKKATPFF